MSPVEHDLFRWFWGLPPLAVTLILLTWSPFLVWIAENIRYHTEAYRPPYGLAITRWTSCWVGDIFIALLAGVLALWLHKVEVPSSLWTDTSFSFVALALGEVLTFMFVFVADNPTWGNNLVNMNRIVHVPFFFVASTLLFDGGLKAIKFGLIDGYERGFAWFAFALLLAYVITLAVDALDKSFVWHLVQDKWPNKTRRP